MASHITASDKKGHTQTHTCWTKSGRLRLVFKQVEGGKASKREAKFEEGMESRDWEVS